MEACLVVEMVNTGPAYNREKFFELMKKPVMREKVVVAGGKAAWQLADEINGLPGETTDEMTPEHWQLFGECIDHDLRLCPN